MLLLADLDGLADAALEEFADQFRRETVLRCREYLKKNKLP